MRKISSPFNRMIDDALDGLEIFGMWLFLFIFLFGMAIGFILPFYYMLIILFNEFNIFQFHMTELYVLIIYSIICWMLYFYATFRD